MFNPEMLSGRFHHISRGAVLEKNDDRYEVIDEVVQWFVDHPKDDASVHSVIDTESSRLSRDGKKPPITFKTDVSYNGFSNEPQTINVTVDVRMGFSTFRYFPRTNFDYRGNPSRFYNILVS